MVPNVTSYVKSTVKIDENKMPLNTSFNNSTVTISPKWKNGMIANFSIIKRKSALLTLIGNDGHYIELGATVNINNINDDLFIGDEGKLYINDISNLQQLTGRACYGDNNCCRFNIPVDKGQKPADIIINLGETICKK